MRPCLDCGQPTAAGSRCPRCEADRQRVRNASRPQYRGAWPRISRALVEAYVAAYGPVCPGFGVPAHAVRRRDLTTDHRHDGSLAVLCRSCNARKGAVAPVFDHVGRVAFGSTGRVGGRGVNERLAGSFHYPMPPNVRFQRAAEDG